MKKLLVSIFILSSLVYASGMGDSKKHKMMFQSVPMDKASILQDGKSKMYCPVCGMTLPMFYKTNHAATHKGHTKQYCSMHCLAEDKIKNGFDAKDMKVVDAKTYKFIDVNKATYVVGSSKKGTMTMISKYAFLDLKDAQKFARENGGKIMGFKEAYKTSADSLEKDMKMVEKKQSKMSEKGKMIYNKMCKKTDKKFTSTADAKTFVKSSKICGDMHGKKLQAVGIYLGRR
jgi:nitrous oxide reductase accessory protein NosL